MKIFYLIQDYLYAAFYHAGKTIYGKYAKYISHHSLVRVSEFFFFFFTGLPLIIVSALYLSQPISLIVAVLIGLFYLAFLILYDKRTKHMEEGDMDERYIRFLNLNIWTRLPFLILAYSVLICTYLALLALLYFIMSEKLGLF